MFTSKEVTCQFNFDKINKIYFKTYLYLQTCVDNPSLSQTSGHYTPWVDIIICTYVTCFLILGTIPSVPNIFANNKCKEEGRASKYRNNLKYKDERSWFLLGKILCWKAQVSIYFNTFMDFNLESFMRCYVPLFS